MKKTCAPLCYLVEKLRGNLPKWIFFLHCTQKNFSPLSIYLQNQGVWCGLFWDFGEIVSRPHSLICRWTRFGDTGNEKTCPSIIFTHGKPALIWKLFCDFVNIFHRRSKWPKKHTPLLFFIFVTWHFFAWEWNIISPGRMWPRKNVTLYNTYSWENGQS